MLCEACERGDHHECGMQTWCECDCDGPEGIDFGGRQEAGDPNDVVGHKTFDTGEIDPETGFPKLRHEPLTRAEADVLWEASEKHRKERSERMPDEQAALKAMFDAFDRLRELGWREGKYCPKDGSRFRVIELGSTGIFDGDCTGTWPDCTWTTYDGFEAFPSSQAPALFKLSPEDQAAYDARMAEAAARYADSTHDWFTQQGRNFESCRNCGFIRRADRKNKPCRGVVKVGPRQSTGGELA